jgi:hypothetical protein
MAGSKSLLTFLPITPMPKVAVHKNDDMPAPKDYVRASRELS